MKHIYFVLLFAGSSAFSQTTVSFTADKDNTIYSQSGAVSNGSGDYMFAGVTNGGARRRALVHFDLSSIPTTATITDAKLKISCNKLAANAAGISAHRISANWGEGTSNANAEEGQGAPATTNDATWTSRLYPSTAWTTAGGDFVATASATEATVSMGPVELSGSNLLADVQLFVNMPSTNFGWIINGSNEGANGSALRFGTRENSTVSEQPTLEITYTTGTVPVLLSKFSATPVHKDALLDWSTVTEINNLFFEIENSSDGKKFTSLARIAGNGTSTIPHHYSYTHRNIPAGKNYYRLLQQNVDGSKKYSPIVVVFSTRQMILDVFPNPAKNVIQVNAPFLLQKIEYFISNISGQIVQRGILNSQQLFIDNLPAGQYTFSVKTPDGEQAYQSFLKR